MSTTIVVNDDALPGTESNPEQLIVSTGTDLETPTPDQVEQIAEAVAEPVAEAVAAAVIEDRQTALLNRLVDQTTEILQRLPVEPEATPEAEAVAVVAVEVEAEAEAEPEAETPPDDADARPVVETRPRSLWQRIMGSGRRN